MIKARQELPRVIDGQVGNDKIANIFFEKSKNLYNTIGFTPGKITELKQNIERKLEENCMQSTNELNTSKTTERHLHNLAVNDLKKAVDDLKSDKKDDTGICTNHIINGTHKLHIVLTMLFNTMLRHGTAPDALLQGTMLPLVKDKRGKLQSNNNWIKYSEII